MNAAPYEDPAASAAIQAIMDRLDFPALLRRVDDGYCTWRQPSLLLFGTSGASLGAGLGRWVDAGQAAGGRRRAGQGGAAQAPGCGGPGCRG